MITRAQAERAATSMCDVFERVSGDAGIVIDIHPTKQDDYFFMTVEFAGESRLMAPEDINPGRDVIALTIDDTVINVGRLEHLASRQAYDMIRDRYGKSEVTDACAVTIASWWQSPANSGMPFASLASTGRVTYGALQDAIRRERASDHLGEIDRVALDMLATWALAKIRAA